MKVLVACEFSGRVREAFRALGHDAWSCDLLPTELYSAYHIRDDVRNHLIGWDLMIAHPPCTYLAVSNVSNWKAKASEQAEALEFVRELLAAPIPRIALENPVGCLSSRIRMPDQIINPWQFGHEKMKRTCLWLKNLPLLVPTDVRTIRESFLHNLPPTPYRWMHRSRTFKGIAKAMAEQWGIVQEDYVLPEQPIRTYQNIMPIRKHGIKKVFILDRDY
jgi:hypothetical protein